MVRTKKAGKRKLEEQEGPSRSDGRELKPSLAFQMLWIKCIVDFYESESTMSLQTKYVRYKEECPEKFMNDMWERFMTVSNVPQWQHEMEKSGFDQLKRNKLHDSLWNAKDILTKYARHHKEGDEAFQQVILRAELFVAQCKPFASSRNRRGSMTWWRSSDGIAEMTADRQHLVALPDTAEVIPCDEKVMKGGYATIWRVKIWECREIPEYWEFAAKLSLLHRTQPARVRLEHQNESMAVRIGHAGVIRFNAVHARRNEGYAYWWNGGTLQNMLNLDRKYPDNIALHLTYSLPTEADVIEAHHFKRFRKKRTELAWALVHIMHAVHDVGYLHNDISLDNILLHFPTDESRVYIGVCNWGMSTYASEAPKSLYVFTSAREMNDTLARRWWVNPQLAYLHQRDGDVQIIPSLSRASEEFAICKIALAINNNNMSEEYWKLNQKTTSMSRMSHVMLAQVFVQYLERPCREGADNAGGLAHIIIRLTTTFNWPIPHAHFRRSYE